MVKTYDRGDGLLVDYSDYAALEAERDEWKRRCEAMAKLSNEWHESNGCVDHWERSKGYLARAIAITEGRDK